MFHMYDLVVAPLCYSYYYLCFMGKKLKCRRKFIKLVGVIDLTPKLHFHYFGFLDMITKAEMIKESTDKLGFMRSVNLVLERWLNS